MKGAGWKKKIAREKIGTASARGKGAGEDGGEGHESSKGERMGLDGKLTRSLLPGALGAENKEKETEIVREGERERGGREVEEIASHIGDRLARAMGHFVRLFRQSGRFIYLAMTNLLRDLYESIVAKIWKAERGRGNARGRTVPLLF